ncbi:hypothetical protein CES85_3246 (plasmid) [Ochrobactrum quorumnocens]|uniref:Uncharacterized protein n=1 Tax=Ochrobactrum quorumnocens TaxID=271865 RepID=A0A248UQW3_9HYPH|nr:hypothetical protein [[Ochrobactrum] quorumnocens]ASV88649.1 hypothetical protein CES85_3246 [[Ochrobactrum] quorumnocens]
MVTGVWNKPLKITASMIAPSTPLPFTDALDLKNAIHIGHCAAGGEVTRMARYGGTAEWVTMRSILLPSH